ncbi:hypothetical protein J437_LFUL012038 [Ladona fulva]|uniref:Uncharacterized protein n=1 Tax=Ladona fulva TaxID=123851 RepID=A0A8K0KCB5_LADFU|nr:hypothetical protein J437_LFUL012038 [Ladona fulva]
MLAHGVIRKEKTAYVNPLLVVKRKHGGVRLCLDARQLNSLTIPENDVPPRIDDSLRNVHGSLGGCKKKRKTGTETAIAWMDLADASITHLPIMRTLTSMDMPDRMMELF